jgi:hypothetical protein
MQVPLGHSRDSFRGLLGKQAAGLFDPHNRYLTTELALFAKNFLHVSDFPLHFAGDLFRRATVL